jgi:hypothetical protein
LQNQLTLTLLGAKEFPSMIEQILDDAFDRHAAGPLASLISTDAVGDDKQIRIGRLLRV